MAHLTDMEELVSTVQDGNIRDYMSESLSCYMTGAYRASVVLTFIALFDDIVAKLGELGKVNKKAKAIHDAAVKKRADQEVFETFLIDQLRANSLLTSLDAGFLETLRTLRNKAAHPSGHHASPEEARFVFFEAVSRFLSRPILSTTQLADEILSSLSNGNLFPSTDIAVITKVVEKELSNIHSETYPYLVAKILEKTQGADKDAIKNSVFFLSGLARTGDADAIDVLKKYVIDKKASDNAFHSAIASLICANGNLIAGLDEITYQRLGVMIADQIEKVDLTVAHTKFSHPVALFVSLLESGQSALVSQKFSAQFNALLDRFTYSAVFAHKVLPFEAARGLLVEKMCERAGSVDFNTANDFVKHISDIEKVMADGLTPVEAFRILVSVIKAAQIGAWSAIDITKAHFGSVPKLRSRANNLLENDSASAKAIADKILGDRDVEELLKALQQGEEVA